MSTIKKGYKLTIKSSENDYDYVQDISFEGMSKQKVEDVLEILTFFKKSYWEGGLGNACDHEFDEYIKRIEELVLPLDAAKRLECTSADHITEIASDYLGYTEQYTRMFEMFTVEFIPEDIEIKDVTSEFK